MYNINKLKVLILLSIFILALGMNCMYAVAEENKTDIDDASTADYDMSSLADRVNTLTDEDLNTIISSGSSIEIVPAESKDKASNNQNMPTMMAAQSAELIPPLVPTISAADSIVTIEPGRAVTGYRDIPVTKVEDFEDKKPEFNISGNWFLTSEAKTSGNYSLRSFYVYKNSSSVCNISVNVPADAINPKLSFDWALSGRAQNDYFLVGLDGTWLWGTTNLLNTWYTITLDLVPGKTNVVNLAFVKNQYCWDGFNTAFVDNVAFSYARREYTYGDIQKAQYKINNGEWQEYKGPFIPDILGQITVTARTVDSNGLYSKEVSKSVFIERNPLMEATKKVEYLEGLLKDLSNQDKVDVATKVWNEANQMVTALPDSSQKQALIKRLETAKLKIDVAQVDLAVKVAEALSADLNTWERCDAAQTAIDKALELVNALPDCADKVSFAERLKTVQLAVDIARAGIKVDVAENSINQADVNVALAYIAKLPEGEAKTALLNRIGFVQKVIDATNQVNTALDDCSKVEATLLGGDLSSKQFVASLRILIGEANKQYDIANAMVASLPSTDKQALTQRIDTLKQLLSSMQGLTAAIQQIINDSAAPLSGNGKERKENGMEIKLQRGSTINILNQYSNLIEENLKTLDNIRLVSFDVKNITVTQDGNITAISNGLARVTVFNKNGILNFFIISNGKAGK